MDGRPSAGRASFRTQGGGGLDQRVSYVCGQFAGLVDLLNQLRVLSLEVGDQLSLEGCDVVKGEVIEKTLRYGLEHQDLRGQ